MAIEHASIRKILYINLAFIGDIILATPTVRALKNYYPNASIDMLVTPWAAKAAEGNPYINKVILYDKRGEHRNLLKFYQLLKQLCTQHYDLSIAANFAPRGAFVAWTSGVRYRVGYNTRGAGLFLTHTVLPDRSEIKHEIEYQIDILKPLGIHCRDTRLEFKVQPSDMASMLNKVQLIPNRQVVTICPFGRHPLNSWRLDGYAALVQQLSEKADCFLIGGKGEKSELERINHNSGNQAQILAGELTIGELAAFLSKINLLITVDTGPMHIAGAVGTKILALFGRSDPRVWGPRGPADIVLRTDLDCVPCIIPRECEHHRCMRELSIDRVIAAARQMLAERP